MPAGLFGITNLAVRAFFCLIVSWALLSLWSCLGVYPRYIAAAERFVMNSNSCPARNGTLEGLFVDLLELYE